MLAKKLRHSLILNFTMIQDSKERNDYLLDKRDNLKMITEIDVFNLKGYKDIKLGIRKSQQEQF